MPALHLEDHGFEPKGQPVAADLLLTKFGINSSNYYVYYSQKTKSKVVNQQNVETQKLKIVYCGKY